jgi:hypothetical protein
MIWQNIEYIFIFKQSYYASKSYFCLIIFLLLFISNLDWIHSEEKDDHKCKCPNNNFKTYEVNTDIHATWN